MLPEIEQSSTEDLFLKGHYKWRGLHSKKDSQGKYESFERNFWTFFQGQCGTNSMRLDIHKNHSNTLLLNSMPLKLSFYEKSTKIWNNLNLSFDNISTVKFMAFSEYMNFIK